MTTLTFNLTYRDPGTDLLTSNPIVPPTPIGRAVLFPVPTYQPLEAHYPAPQSEVLVKTPYTHWQTGEPLKLTFWARHGSPPYWVDVDNMILPAGATFGDWLESYGSNGELIPGEFYMNFYWSNPTAGVHNIYLPIYDQMSPTPVEFDYNITIGAGHCYFVASTPTGSGDGSSSSNFADVNNYYGVDESATSAAFGKILCLGNCNYSVNRSLHLNTTKKPNSMVGLEGYTSLLTAANTSARLIFNASDAHIQNIKTLGFGGDMSGDGSSSTLSCADLIHNVGIVDCYFEDSYADSSVSSNNAVIYFNDSGTKRNHILLARNTFKNCLDIVLWDTFSCNVLNVLSKIETTQVIRTDDEFLIKGSNNYHILWLTSINPLSEDGIGSTLNFNNNEVSSQSKGSISFSRIISKSTGSELGVLYNNNINTHAQVNDAKNTYKCRVSARKWQADSLVTFYHMVLQSNLGGVASYDPGFDGNFVTVGGVIGSATVVDADGRLLDTTNKVDGWQIWSAS